METQSVHSSIDEVSESYQIHEPSSLRQVKPVSKTLDGVDREIRLQAKDAQEVAEELAEKMNSVASVFNTQLSFSVDDGTGRTVIEVKDTETHEVIRQIPPEHILQLIGKMRDVMGMVLNVKI